MASDNESNVSGFVRCNDQNIVALYRSAIENMQSINLDLLQVENNLRRVTDQSGPLESHLRALLRTLPLPELNLQVSHMETE